jgi:LacI family transcriptional regulator
MRKLPAIMRKAGRRDPKMISKQKPPLEVAILVETSTSWGAEIVRGIAAYAERHGPWYFYLEPRGRYESLHLPARWKGQGIIARVITSALAREIVRSGIPAVNVSCFEFEHRRIPTCTSDEQAVGALAADHFLQRGFTQFAYCGVENRPGYIDRMGQSFLRHVRKAGFTCRTFNPLHSPGVARTWQQQRQAMSRWLEQLPKPVGLFTWNDVRGRQVTEACRYSGIAVPDEVAVMGGEYDELTGSIASPPLSSIDPAAFQVGYRAAELLDRLMAGKPAPADPIRIAPVGVMVRPSSDTIAVDDPELATAVRFIRRQALKGISVKDVVRHVSLSRRGLELKFRRKLGHSPVEEIRRIQLDKAKQLLINTRMTIPQVAAACGFSTPETFTKTFHRSMDLPPTAYRKNMES